MMLEENKQMKARQMQEDQSHRRRDWDEVGVREAFSGRRIASSINRTEPKTENNEKELESQTVELRRSGLVHEGSPERKDVNLRVKRGTVRLR